MNWTNEHHEILAIVSAVACNSLLVWAIVDAYLYGKRCQLNRLLATHTATAAIDKLLEEDYKEELKNNIITEEWNI